MTEDITNQRQNNGSDSLLPTLVLLFAGLTLLFALLSMMVGNRASTLRVRHTQAMQETRQAAETEAASLETLQTAMVTVRADLETAQKDLKVEKTAAERLKRQLSAAMKDLKATRTALNSANQTIDRLKVTLPAAPVVDEPPPVSPDRVHAPPIPPAQPAQPAAPITPPPAPTEPPDSNIAPKSNEPGTLESTTPPGPATVVTEETLSDLSGDSQPVPAAVE